MGKYILSSAAQKSLRKIHTWSQGKFGKAQTSLYMTALRDRMRNLSDHPRHGQERPEIKRGYYSYFEGSHVIYYKIYPDHIGIIDILHQSMEPLRHVS